MTEQEYIREIFERIARVELSCETRGEEHAALRVELRERFATISDELRDQRKLLTRLAIIATAGAGAAPKILSVLGLGG